MAAAALEAQSLSKRYGRSTWALRNVNLAIPVGRITALVGPNAAGKSTLMRTWVGFERPTEGAVRVDGIDPWSDRRAALARIGYVPQSPALYDTLTVERHLLLAREVRPGFDTGLAIQRLERLGIPLDRRGRQLSGGQQAQVALALAVGTRARILLLDEPLADLDPLARQEFLHVLREAVATSTSSAVLSSHVVSDVEQACDYIVVLGVGQVLLHAAIEDARLNHAVTGGPQQARDIVATFTSADGTDLTLTRHSGQLARGWRPATLEEIVLGYLTAGRTLERGVE